jgi:hypothetical protein
VFQNQVRFSFGTNPDPEDTEYFVIAPDSGQIILRKPLNLSPFNTFSVSVGFFVVLDK